MNLPPTVPARLAFSSMNPNRSSPVMSVAVLVALMVNEADVQFATCCLSQMQGDVKWPRNPVTCSHACAHGWSYKRCR